MRWEDEYREKTVTAQEAAAKIKSGSRIMTGNRDARAVLDAIMDRSDLEDVYYYAPIINYMRDTPSLGRGFRPATSFLNENSLGFEAEGRLDFIPSDYWLYNKIGRELGCKIALIEVTKPDAHGYMSFGTCVDSIRDFCREADLVIAETNPRFPFIYGSNLIHVSEVDFIVDEGANYQMPDVPVDVDEENAATYRAIGGYLSELIPDEATIEVGLGRLNAASLMFMEEKRDLGVHTEVYGDILMHLTEKGIITNERKSQNRGVATFTQVVGTQKLFDWADHNLGLRIDNCREVLNPGTICAQHRMIAINNAIEVDLLGQANSEFLRGKQYSGLGGLCNFAAGAAACMDGKSIVVLESVTKNGKFSKICASLKPNTPVSLPRTYVEYVVTEQGIAKLAGKSPKERARALISVAHPKFRDELTAEAKAAGII